jgi:transposase
MSSNTRDWSQYNKAQVEELSVVVTLIREFVDSLDVQEAAYRTGRPSKDLKDILKIVLLKAYMNLANRRLISWIYLLYEKLGLQEDVPHFNTVGNYVSDPKVKHYLEELIHKSNAPVKDIDFNLSTDSTGFHSKTTSLWMSVKHLKPIKKKDFVKLHITSRTKTNVIAVATVSSSHDSPEFREHAKTVKERGYKVGDWCGDSAYLARQNCTIVHELGGFPYFKPKKNTKSIGLGHPAWKQMIWLHKKSIDQFKTHYHKRSNSETHMFCLKSILGAFVRTKNVVGQTNELLAKIVIHNYRQLCHALFLLNINIYPT